MKKDDIRYICTTIGNLAGIPIRIYEKGKKTFYYSIVDLQKDPILPYEEKILEISSHIGSFITPRFHYYGIVNSAKYQIILGPSRQWTANKSDLQELAFECDVPPEETNGFISAMENLITMPLSSILQTLCSINFILNGEKLSLADIMIYDDEQQKLSEQMEKAYAEQNSVKADSSDSVQHNTLALEQTIENIVQSGNTTALKDWIGNAPAVRPGILSSDTVRHMKNIFIVTATLVSRAAIRGYMDSEDALTLSDAYIQKCELLSTPESIENLQYLMVLDYTERVEKLHAGKNPTKLTADIANYVQKHLSEPINIEALAKAMFISRTHLAAKFKKATGMTLTEYILKQKTEEAKRLLRYTNKPIATISAYLGFSSQSHFSGVFKKRTGRSPNEYRELHKQ